MEIKYTKISLLFCVVGLSSEAILAANSTPTKKLSPHEAQLQALESLYKEMDTIGANRKRLSTSYDKSQTCDFSLICSRLSENAHSDYFYRNSNGEQLPNYPLKNLKKVILNCKASLKEKINAAANPQGIQNNDFLAQSIEAQKKQNEKARMFLTLLADKKLETDYVKVSKAMLDLPLDIKSIGYGMYADPAAIRKKIEDAQSKLGLQLGEDVIDAWVNSLIPDYSAFKIPGHARVDVDPNENPFDEASLLTNPQAAGSKEAVLKNQEKFQTALTKTFKIFKDTQQRIVNELLKRRNKSNYNEIDSMIRRVQEVIMKSPPIGGGNMIFSACGAGPNAFYSTQEHSVTVCPEFLQMPAASIQTIIAHEIAHAIDPCTASFALNEVKGDKLQGQNFSSPFAGSSEIYIPFDPKLPPQRTRSYCSFDEGILKDRMKFTYRNPVFVPVAIPVGLRNNPFEDVIECLESKDSVRARMGDLSAVKERFIEKIKKMQADGANEKSPELIDLRNRYAEIEKNWSNRRACGFIPSKNQHGTSQMQEAFSDWLSGQVMAQKIEETTDPKLKNQLAFETVSPFAIMNGCKNFQGEIAARVMKLTKDAGCTPDQSSFAKDLSDMRNFTDVHPEDDDRVSRIFMAHPKIQETLGCGRKAGVKNCE